MHASEPGPAFVWRVTDEFRQRAGCASLAIWVLPAWFVVVLIGIGGRVGPLATLTVAMLAALSAVVGVAAAWRLARLPREISLDGGGWLTLRARRRETMIAVEDIRRLDIGHSPGLSSLRLNLRGGRRVILPGDLDDLDGFVSALRTANPFLDVVDERKPPERPE
jgi:hypothetical protein